ncbi:MAG: hypothetical protein ACRDIU_07675 [Actinomycetota bacterium]
MSFIARPVAVAALALAGMIGGHIAAYILVEPHSGSRAALLADSGHHYPGIPIILLAVLFTAAGSAVLWGMKERAANLPPCGLWAVLSVLQTAGFLATEACERLLTGGSFAHFGTLTVGGLLLQVPLAWLGSQLLKALRRFGRALAAVLKRPCFSAPPNKWSLCEDFLPDSPGLPGRFARGPPFSQTQTI